MLIDSALTSPGVTPATRATGSTSNPWVRRSGISFALMSDDFPAPD
ncbi:MAG: hypothetical protein IPK16_19860 [Anaerolineales bacterium]|nr:hypothetical protein [Anaerolineales bacterium]